MMKMAFLGSMALVALLGLTAGPARADDDTKGPAQKVGRSFVDADGDGVCDNCTSARPGQGRGQGKGTARVGNSGRRGGYGPGDGTGNQGVGPRDGSGKGRGSRAGDCDGSGPHGQGSRGRGQGRRGGRP